MRSFAGSEPADVYDLMVEGQHEFVACGVIVHNCVWAITELHSLSAGDWFGAYGVVECHKCGHKYMGEVHERCPKCGTEKIA